MFNNDELHVDINQYRDEVNNMEKGKERRVTKSILLEGERTIDVLRE